MNIRRSWCRTYQCRKCGRLIAYTVNDGRLPCAWEEWQQRRRRLSLRRHLRIVEGIIASRNRAGRYVKLQASKRAEAEADRLAALQEVLPLCQ